MPRFDGTGPMGLGPGTGRGMGPCGGRFGAYRGFGYGFGYERFRSPRNELAALTAEEKELEDALAIIREEKAALKKA